MCMSANIERACPVGPARLCSKFFELFIYSNVLLFQQNSILFYKLSYYSLITSIRNK